MKSFCFQKSSHSSGGGECVEIARNVPGAVAVRDSKQVDGPVIVLAPTAWDAFQVILLQP
ncbi:DUF397 domain-containing protein [Streptomyces sp. ATexAB-D23]|uniref:DUF397 domain-containing protein n=1 Tax=unclassified Streptomyces TaxID=2593676 RepID=UPI00099873F0|nr:DUF397 domain-containing protein [Streptomyces sp. ATexAB-D23]MYY04846.1 DUF397 domain-containing protein [Streptomyces sp. SID4913]